MKNEVAGLVPIRTVCSLYQLNPNTLRTWERRYGVIKPQRSAGGHRGYARQDMVVIECMVRLLRDGKSPSEAAKECRQLIAFQATQLAHATELRKQYRQKVREMNTTEIIRTAFHCCQQIGYRLAIEDVLFPELAYWGKRFECGHPTVAYEHLASLGTESCLFYYQQKLRPADGTSPVTLACAPDEMHEYPLLHFSNLLMETNQLRPVVLVGGLPMQEVLETARKTDSCAIVLSATMQPSPDKLRQWISQIRLHGWETRTMLAGGGFARSRIFSESRVHSSPSDFQQAVRVLTDFICEKESDSEEITA